MAEVARSPLLGPAALAEYLQHGLKAPASSEHADPPLWRLLLTPRWLARLQLQRLSAKDLVRLHSLPDTVAALAGRGISLSGTRALESLYRWHGFAEACLRELRSRRHTSRADTARGLFREAGSGLSNEAVDHLLGMNVSDTMQAVDARTRSAPDPAGSWRWQAPGATTIPQTRYEDLVTMVRAQPQGAHVVDLGSGFGRLGFVAGLLRPDLQFTGLELVPERVEEATRVTRALGLQTRVEHECCDLTTDPVPTADTYFLFFSFPPPTAARVLSQLESVAQHRRISLVVHGGWPGGGLDRVSWLARQPRLGPLEHYISTSVGARLDAP